MTDKREKIKTKVLFISASIILFHFSNGKIYDSSELLNGLFEVEVTNVLITGFIIIYLYYFIRFFALREDNEFKNMFKKIYHYRNENRLFRFLIKRKALKEINNIKPIENTLQDELNRFGGNSVRINDDDEIITTNHISKQPKSEREYTARFINSGNGKWGYYKVKVSKLCFNSFLLFSYPKYLFEDYFWETILPYITFIWSSIIVLSYLIGLNEIIIVSK